MIPELGQYALILSLCMSVLLGFVPLIGAARNNALWCGFARPLAVALFGFVLFSFLCLAWAFYSNDFSVAYVASNSNSALPWYFRLSAVWGGHEGSLLLWLLILAGWTVAVAIKSDNLPDDMRARVLAVMGLIATGFILFVLFTSSPFERYLPQMPQEGADLNPLLQDFGLIVHPPMLYMGYVGFSVAFAFAIAALLSGRLDAAWARWSRPWTNIAWAFLTLGIALGSWWAYYELGWGGWWFWDPVENASLMPWLVGTALVHSLAVTEKRGVFKSWTVLLAIFAFSLSLLGTFLVRSGVLTSVHAFASDPDRGFFILALLAIAIGGSLLLYAFKASHVKSESSFGFVSRETLLLVNNVLLTVSCATVLLGTLYPLLIDALGLGKLSVGPPYFNALFVPLGLLLMISLGVGTLVRWKQTSGALMLQQLWLPGVLALVAGALSVVSLPEFPGVWVSVGLVLAWWIVFTGLRDLFNRVRAKSSPFGAVFKQSRAYYGMMFAHAGVAVLVVGVALVSTFSEHSDLRMEPGDRKAFNDYEFVFERMDKVDGPNFHSDTGVIQVLYKGKPYTTMYPEKRLYTARNNVMTEAAIDPGLFRDLYVALGESLDGDAWAIRVQYKPFVRWIWLGGLLMTLGGILAATDPRYRKQARRDMAAQSA
ncbi:heme lyase CcmF/NrfE family subunit [Marinobacterium lutimaris]|uniref:Cytochrome c-type biogenesis protein CcmF n=1 Tax=Marinobacterium lutimaris TaxID=568106 RepID=A0A1H6BCF7_9GAMM|nr:heme lyase CcmF/NrfE family subunit [Marinobacterium lutimaris]SEG57886.1 cytochrome c-type biogenesis protein CcmF [Marinobacterium lutimaris]